MKIIASDYDGTLNHGGIDDKKKKILTISPFKDSYYNLYYMRNSVSRMCCYSCKYATHKRVGDFTIGDYWNIPDVVPHIDYEKGTLEINGEHYPLLDCDFPTIDPDDPAKLTDEEWAEKFAQLKQIRKMEVGNG